jgi:glycosyltransferase involved in cell wall biosynthesis
MKKKICFVVSTPFTANAFLLKHFEFLSFDFDIYLVANFEGNKSVSFSSDYVKGTKNIAIQRDIAILSDIKSLHALSQYFIEMKFDAVHTVTPKAGLLGIFAARVAGIKTRIHIFTGQVWHTKKGIFKKLLMFLDRFIVMSATNILVDGESQRQFLIKNKIVTNKQSCVLGKGSISGVDIKRFMPNTISRNEIRERLGFQSSDVVFMFLGRMNKDKGINELALAFDKLSQKYTNVRLLLVGEDECNMMSIIQHKVLNINYVVFCGLVPKPEQFVQACDVFCLPSFREGFGTSVIEASLLGKPVICSDTYGLKDTIIDFKTGLRHKVGDVDSLYLQMEILLTDKEYREVLGKAGREYVIANFSSEHISEQWVKFYRQCLA